jgi:hypothetical protein
LCQIAAAKVAHCLNGVPWVLVFAAYVERTDKQPLGFNEVFAKYL